MPRSCFFGGSRPLLCLFLSVFFLQGLVCEQARPEIRALAAVLMDAKTGTVLYEKNGAMSHPPASLTKVMTIHLLLEEISSGRLSPYSKVEVPPASWASNLPRDSSLMFLGPEQSPSVKDILEGLAVASGNDAAVAAAHLVAGSVPSFTSKMNEEAKRLGLAGLFFVEPSGYDERNRITARDFALFCKYYLDRHPQALAELHSVREFSYPRPENLVGLNHMKPIVQYNRNSLLLSYPGVDGIKTGYLHESGFNIAVTARRNDMRLILVQLGEEGTNQLDGIRQRNRDAKTLLNYGFDNFTTLKIDYPRPESVRIWKGDRDFLVPKGPDEVWVTVRKGSETSLRGEISQANFATAPIPRGAVLGTVKVTSGESTIFSGELKAEVSVERGPWWKVAYHSVLVFLRGLFGYPV